MICWKHVCFPETRRSYLVHPQSSISNSRPVFFAIAKYLFKIQLTPFSLTWIVCSPKNFLRKQGPLHSLGWRNQFRLFRRVRADVRPWYFYPWHCLFRRVGGFEIFFEPCRTRRTGIIWRHPPRIFFTFPIVVIFVAPRCLKSIKKSDAHIENANERYLSYEIIIT